MDISVLNGLVISSIKGMEAGSEEIIIKTECGRTFRMYHDQDCCESVSLEDVCGSVKDLTGHRVSYAEEVCSGSLSESSYGTETWTFYHIVTGKGCVTLRWYGESNGYYSESVDFDEVLNQS